MKIDGYLAGTSKRVFRFDQLFTTSTLARFVVYGGPGNDTITVADSITLPALLFAGDGNDFIKGGTASVLAGEAGNDRLIGGRGRNLMIGGLGSDALNGRKLGDILIGGTTDHDGNLAALEAVMAEWARTDADYRTRVNHLLGPSAGGTSGGGNAPCFLNATTVHDDDAVDLLLGGEGLDWFFADLRKRDQIRSVRAGEIITRVP